HQCSSALGSAVLRCDKLEREEVKSLLMCFLHVLKSMSEEALFTYWNKASPSDLMDFFTLLEVCLHQFRYVGKRNIARSQEGAGLVAADRKSLTLPVSLYSHTEPEVTNQCLLEANVSTEVCLTVLDTLSVFITGFKVPPPLAHA
ncbi:hypothetical protein CRUP_028086, partial [Coryphaenoides rupestris]